jgi:DNA gyrase subunit A
MAEITIDELMTYVTGPDFPTGAIINGVPASCRPIAPVAAPSMCGPRPMWKWTRRRSRETIIVHELPYQVNKARLIEKIAELVKEKKVEGISALRDESDKDGMRIVIEIKRGESGEIVLNNLYKHTQMQTTFGINMVALDNNQPKVMNLKEILDAFLLHRREVVTRRTVFELRKARDRAHILEGLAVALANIDPIIELIRSQPTPADAKAGLVAKGWELGNVAAMLEKAGDDAARPEWLEPEFGIREGQYFLTEIQAQAILDLRLHKLTGLEHEKILEEYQSLLDLIAELLHILASPERLMEVIRDELLAVREQYGDERRTEISMSSAEINIEDLITPEDVVVTLSHQGYVKYQPLSDYEAQRRGGRGKSATRIKEEDFVERLLVANTHDTILCFSTRGKVYWLKVYQLPEASRGARGRPIINLLPLEEGERITAILPVKEYDADKYVFFATANGTVKKTTKASGSLPCSWSIRPAPCSGLPRMAMASAPRWRIFRPRGAAPRASLPSALPRATGPRWVPCWYCPRMRSCSLPWVAPWCAPPWHRSPPLAAPPRASSSSASERASAWRAWNVFLPWKGAPRKAKKVAKARTRAPRARSWLEGAGARRAICLTTL